jgi:hypothetical protein
MKLNIGCGNVPLVGYINVDKYYYPSSDKILTDFKLAETWNIDHPDSSWLYGDMEKLDMFANNTFDEVMIIHALEHVSMEAGNRSIVEAVRVLKSGSQIDIEVPDLFKACQLLPTLEVESPLWYRTMGCIYGTSGYDGEGQFHLCGYSIPHLKYKMEQHDLINIQEIPVGFGHGNNLEGHPEPEYDFRLRGTKK